MKRRGVPTVYYVAPQFWAWRQGRVRLIRDYIDKALVIFPFEEKFYRDRGVDAKFVGHPLAELSAPAIERASYAAQFGLDPAKQWITLMPGSRIKEVRMNLPTILESAALLGSDYEFFLPVAPTIDRALLQSLVGEQKITLVPEALPALWHSRAGIVASGTATVEAAMMNLPFVMVYRVSTSDLPAGKATRKGPAVRHGEPDRRGGSRPGTGATGLHRREVVRRVKEILPEGPARERMLQGIAGVEGAACAGAAPGPARASGRPCGRNHSLIVPQVRATGLEALISASLGDDKAQLRLNLVLPASFASESSS